MKSSSISLFFEDDVTVTDESTGEKVSKCAPYLINLVDSPGHIDFSSDVSAAVRLQSNIYFQVRLCDGCLIIVDAIEGVCTQTLTVIQQAFQEGVKPILIINKIDRLILHLKQTPMDAYQHIRNIIERVNAYISNLYTADVISNTATTVYFKLLNPLRSIISSHTSSIVKKKSNYLYLLLTELFSLRVLLMAGVSHFVNSQSFTHPFWEFPKQN